MSAKRRRNAADELRAEPAGKAEREATGVESAPVPATNSAPAGRRVTVIDFANEHGLSRHEAEWTLRRLGLCDELPDGVTLFDAGLIDQLLAAEDAQKTAEGVELLGRFADDGLARRIAQEAIEDLRGQWLSAADLRVEVDAVKRALAAKFSKMHQAQTAQRQGDIWAEWKAIDSFEIALLRVLAERRAELAQDGDNPEKEENRV